MMHRHPSICRSVLYLLLAVGVCTMPVANQYRRLAQFVSNGQCPPGTPANTSLPGCRALPDEKSFSEALELSSRDPKQGGATAVYTVAPMIASCITAHRPIDLLSLEIANCANQPFQLQSTRLLI